MLFYISSRVIHRIVNGNLKFNGFEFMFALYLALPLLPAIAAYFVWEQPFYLGFLSFREFYLIGSALVLYNFVKGNISRLKMVEKAMVISAWIALLLFYATSTFMDPAQFMDTKIVSLSANRGGVILFKFNMGFVFFGTIYYFIKLLNTNKKEYFFYFIFFLIYIVFIRQDRSSMISVLGAMGLYFLLYVKLKRKVLYIVSLTIPVIGAIVVGYMLDPSTIEAYVFMFEDLAYAIQGKSNPNVGMSVRIYETAIANTYVEQNPFLGNGKISNYFLEGGFNYLFFYFYPTDIGLIGSVFTYGIPGTLVLYSQFIFAFVWILRVKYFKNNTFFLAATFYLVILLADSLSNGYLTLFASQSISTVAIIFLFYIYDKALVRDIVKTKQKEHYQLEAAI